MKSTMHKLASIGSDKESNCKILTRSRKTNEIEQGRHQVAIKAHMERMIQKGR